MAHSPPRRTITDVLDAHRDALIAVPGVLGTAIGICEGIPCIRVFVSDTTVQARIPVSLEGYVVRPEVAGRFDARQGPP